MTKKTKTNRVCFFVPIDGYIAGEGYRASIVTENEPGHAPTGRWPYHVDYPRPYFWGHDYEEAETAARNANANLGLSERDVVEIIASSMGAPPLVNTNTSITAAVIADFLDRYVDDWSDNDATGYDAEFLLHGGSKIWHTGQTWVCEDEDGRADEISTMDDLRDLARSQRKASAAPFGGVAHLKGGLFEYKKARVEMDDDALVEVAVEVAKGHLDRLGLSHREVNMAIQLLDERRRQEETE